MLGLNKILGYFRRQIGLRTDVASETGSLHAKAKSLLDRPASPIKSIQRGVINMLDSNSTTNVPISSIDINKSVVYITFGGSPTNTATTDPLNVYQRGMVRANLTSNTNLELWRNTAQTSTTLSVAWQVVEYN